MGRLVPRLRIITALILAGSLFGCGSSNPVTSATTFDTPAKVSLTPSSFGSLEAGKTVTFSATASNASNTQLTEPIAYESSNPAVLTITTGGVACAGSWDSLSNPTVCTPGPVGTAVVTAVAQGISSPPTTVYVHQHIDSITVAAQPGQAPQTASCLSKGQTYNYQATAYSRQGGPAPGLDITSTVGPFSWQAVNGSVVTVTAATGAAPVNGLQPGQARLTANFPGVTPIVASVSGVSSAPFTFTTCLVQSISLAPTNGAGNILSVARGSSTSIDATVIDTQGNVINGSFLSWCSSAPGSVSTGSANCGLGSNANFPATASSSGGGAAVIAACTPPNCNINVFPSLPIYPPSPVTVLASGSNTTSGTVTSTAWVTTTGCTGTDGCVTEMAPITTTITNNVSSSTLGTLLSLPATPNSLVFNAQGTIAYLGTDTGELGTRGIMVLNAGAKSVTQFPSVVGKILAVSPDGGSAIVSDTAETPNRVYVFSCTASAATTGGTSSCTSNSSVALNIAGATAAAFSPDGLKAYIAAGATLYVYSKLDALQTIALSTPLNDITFLANGAFAYLAGGAPGGVMVRRTCDNAVAQASNGAPQVVTTPKVPLALKALPDGVHVLGLDPPSIDIVSASNIATSGCTATTAPPPAPPYVSNAVSSFNLGQGSFLPTEFIVSADGSTGYLLTESSGSVVVLKIAAQTTSAIPLSGNVLPLQASLTPDGTSLYVGASDGQVHLLDTVGGADVRQISFPTDVPTLQSGLCGNVNFPIQSVVNITAASQSGSDTTFAYTLTSGPALQVGRRITISGMANAANNGAFTITGVGSGTFTVGNAIGVSASGQSGAGSVAFACNPDLVAVAP